MKLTLLSTCFVLLQCSQTIGAELGAPIPLSKTSVLENKIALLERKIDALAAAQTVTELPAKPAVKTVVAATHVTYRNPVGHTHTCSRCGEVWDHKSNPSHNCPRCGSAQYVQDVVPKLVPVIAATTAVPVTTSPAVATTYYTPYFMNSGGCANGNCNRR